MNQIIRLGRKNAIYLPKSITEALGIKEGDRLRVTIKGDMIIIRPVPRLFVKRRSWASTTIEGLEAESEDLVKRLELGG